MIRVLVADDHLAVREGLRTLLANEREITIVGEADDGTTALALARSLRPDLIVLDDSMPGQGSLDVARKILAELPDTAVVFLARDPGMRDLAFAAGATAFVPKDAPSEELLRALRASTAAVTTRQQLSALRPEGRRVVELLLGSRVMTGEQVQEALAKRATGESLATTVVRLGLVGQPELADILARATDTPFVSLAPYPEISAPIDPTESRLSSPRLMDPVEREAARSVPLDIARGLGVVVTAADRGHGVVAMADPLDEIAFAEAQRHSGLRLTRVTSTADDIKDTLDRVWNGGGSREVIWTGNLLSKLYASLVLGVIVAAGIGGFGLLFRDALAPRFAFSLFALLCGLFFFLYALKYYVTIASVILITLFGDPAKFQGRHGNGHANGNGTGNGNGHTSGHGLKADGYTNGNGNGNGQHKEGYRTLRGEKLSEAGAVVVIDPWQKMGEIRLPADRQPFVSIHLALYNEGRVVDRLLEACTSFDYENYEVIVADDSTDETVEKLKKWREHPRVRVIHRSSRKGFKGGALQEALRRMNPHTEYVMVFDADFVPPADAIWHFLDYFGRLSKPKNGNGNGHAKNGHGAPQNGDRLAVVQGYQWHMLNASENWVTKGVRAEFSGSYVLERAGQELFGSMKMISGSVYMIRADVLRKLGWSTSITEDWELTIRLYLAGYKVLYTPYIQAPAECVSEVRRLIKQRMRWAEGHTYNVRKYFWPILRSPNLTWQEKLEFVYYAPYYLQSVLFTVATVSWIVGVLILGQKLPMWGEIFGWSLVVSNALALPLMNLTGVLLEGSLKRDALGLLSFIGLSWILVPFQAYASLKALFEKKEGGWVRTPKSGRVTETLERFHLARLMPWELPKRKRGQSRANGGNGRAAAAAVVVLTAAGIITVGALSIRAAATSGITNETDLAIPALLGTMVPLLILALGWLRLRRRVTAIVLAFTLGLGTNVVYLAQAVPAAAVTDNSSVFTFRNSTTFDASNRDMFQNYTPSGAGSTCPSTSQDHWRCAFTSDTFTTGQSLNTGTAQSTLYLKNSPVPKFRDMWWTVCGPGCTNVSLYRPPNTKNGDLMLAFIAMNAPKALTAPTGWNFITSVTNGVQTTAYWKIAASSDPAGTNWIWTHSGNVSFAAGLVSYSGVDATTPIDTNATGTDASGTTHTAPSVTTSAANAMVVMGYGLNTNASFTPAAGTTERNDVPDVDNAASMMVSDVLRPSSGATGTFAATSSIAGTGANITVALKAATPGSCVVEVALKKVPATVAAPTLRAAATGGTSSGGTAVINVPAGTQNGDLLIATISHFTAAGRVTGVPAGWTPLRSPYSEYQRGGTPTARMGMDIWWRIANNEPASYTWTSTGVSSIGGGIQAFTGASTTSPFEIDAWQSVAPSSSFPTPSITTTYPNDLVVATHSVESSEVFTPPAGMTQGFDFHTGTAPSVFGISIESAYALQASAGATGSKTATIATNPDEGVTHIMALQSADVTTIASGTATVPGNFTVTAVTTDLTITSGVAMATGDRLMLEVTTPSDQTNCSVQLSYDGASLQSRMVMTTIVPEGIAGLLLLAPALPVGLRWWKRRRP